MSTDLFSIEEFYDLNVISSMARQMTSDLLEKRLETERNKFLGTSNIKLGSPETLSMEKHFFEFSIINSKEMISNSLLSELYEITWDVFSFMNDTFSFLAFDIKNIIITKLI